MLDDSRTDFPLVTHRLGVAVQFFDVFTHVTVLAPLRVTIPSLQLVAVEPISDDGVYRFLLPEPTFPPPPPATVEISVEAEAGDYVSNEPIPVQLPVAPTVPPRRSDYLVRAPLWPAVSARPPPGETAVVGHVVSGTPPNVVPAVGYKVVLFASGETVGSVPYARTDPNGDFLYRLSRLRGSAVGGTVVRTATLSAALFTPTGPPVASVDPATLTVDLGRVLTRQFTVS